MKTYVLVTSPQKEFLVTRILQENGLDAFCPVHWKWRRIRHRTKKREQVAVPKLRGYVFLTLGGPPVGLESVLMDMTKVRYLGSYGAPVALPEGAYEKVLAMSERPTPRKKAYNTHGTFRVGEKVRITEGPFIDHIVDIKDIRGKSARIVLELFGGPREVSIALEELEAA